MNNRLTVNLENLGLDLDANTDYTIEVEPGIVTGQSDGSASIGLSIPVTTRNTGPILVGTDPDLGSTNIFQAIVNFEFDVPVRITSGNLYLYQDDPGGDILLQTFAFNNPRVVVSGNTLGVDVSGFLDDLTTYYVISDPNNISDYIGLLSGVTLEDTLKWTSGLIAPAPMNMTASIALDTDITNYNVNRNFLSNQSNQIFSVNQIGISSNSETINYRFNISVTGGELWKNGTTPVKSITLTGTKSIVLSDLLNYKFYPDVNRSTNATLNVRAERFTDSQWFLLENYRSTLLYAGEGTIDKLLTWPTPASWIADYEDVKYQLAYDIILVGGGSGAGTFAGGGGGMVVSSLNRALSIDINTTYNIMVGGGGAADTVFNNCNPNSSDPGGSSSAFGLIALGGTASQSQYCYDDQPPRQTTWNVQGGDSRYGDGSGSFLTYEGYNLDNGSSNGQSSAATAFYNGNGAGAGGPGTLTERGPGLTTWNGATYGAGGWDGSDDTVEPLPRPTLVLGEGGAVSALAPIGQGEQPGQPGIIVFRVNGIDEAVPVIVTGDAILPVTTVVFADPDILLPPGSVSATLIVTSLLVATPLIAAKEGSANLITSSSIVFDGTVYVNSRAPAPVIAQGDAKIQTGTAFFGTGRAQFDALGDSFVASTKTIDWSTTDDFTVECWILPVNVSANRVIFAGPVGTGSLICELNPVTASIANVRIGNTSGTWNLEATSFGVGASNWYHIAVCRSSGTTQIYIDGTSYASTTTPISQKFETRVGIGGQPGNLSTSSIPGFIDEFRISNVARYTGATFTVPTAAFINDADTVLLCHFDEADQAVVASDDIS